jgi:hypothetical protein
MDGGGGTCVRVPFAKYNCTRLTLEVYRPIPT